MRIALWRFALDKQGDFSWKEERPGRAKWLHHCGSLCYSKHAQRAAFTIQISFSISPSTVVSAVLPRRPALAHTSPCDAALRVFKSATTTSQQHLKGLKNSSLRRHLGNAGIPHIATATVLTMTRGKSNRSWHRKGSPELDTEMT